MRRRGSSAILAEFILIAATLVACIVVSGFTYGLFGSYVPPAEVAAQVSSCSSTNSTVACRVTLSNVGASSTATGTKCALLGVQGALINGGDIPAGGTLSGVSCVVHGGAAETGSMITGSIPLVNGGAVFFTGTSS